MTTAARNRPIDPAHRPLGVLTALLADRTPVGEAVPRDDWDGLVELAACHGLAPVLYERIRKRGIVAPDSSLQKLRAGYLATAARNMQMLEELGKPLGAFHANGIPVAPLKGSCLAETVYGNIALRPMGDVDILVRSRDVAKAVEVLRGLGFESEASFDPVAEQTINHSLVLLKPGGLRLDLHWTLVNPRDRTKLSSEEMEQVWLRARPGQVAGAPVLLLSPTDLLLHLCIHAAVVHRFSEISLRAFVDITRVVDRYEEEIDWQEFTVRASRWGTANGVWLALVLAREWTGLMVSQATLDALKADSVEDETLEWVTQKVLEGSPEDMTSETLGLKGKPALRRYFNLIRTAAGPFRMALAGTWRDPVSSWRSLRTYSGRLIGYVGRHVAVAWRVARHDSAFMADARKEARLREYLGWK